ncbi:MAG: hypothetical protein IJG81_03125 [Muribaculaceae bacterium]|nr:hypothetical protein [Muribaculaceae bacterium]
MRKFLSLSVLFVAMFTTLATNNTAYAQPESFTADFLQEDYRDGAVVRTNVVTVVWDEETQLMTFYNFYGNAKVVANGMVNLPVYQYVQPNKDRTTINWESSTKGTFTWRVSYLGEPKIPGFTFMHSAVVSKMIYTQTPVQAINLDTYQVYNVNYKYDGGGDCDGTIDLDKGEITIDDPWGCCVGQNANYISMGSTRVIEYFEYSKLTLIKTELVDIVNDGTVGEEYTVNDDLVGVATVDGVLSAPMGVNRNQNTFMIDKGRYKLDFDRNANTLTVSQSTQDITGFVNNGSHPTYYVLGQANDNDWNPTVGQPMETTDGVHYSAVVNFDGRDNNKNYFSLTSGLANNNDDGGWNYVNGSCRLGPSYNNYPVTLGNVLFAKDMGKYKYPSQISEGQIDFLGRVETEYMGNTKLQPIADFDQSNWVMLTGVANADNYVGKIIKGKSITGKLVDKVNPTIAVTSIPEVGDPNPYDPNIYIMPSFNEEYYAPNSHFFFVAPKVQEYAYITWACYNAADGNFYTMSDGNVDNLSGGIKVNWDYFPSGNPQDGYVYEFDAILRKVAPATSSAPLLKDGNQSNPVTDDLSTDYIVYPLRLYDVPTAINTVEATGKAVDVKYYNMMGIESSTPFNGVNIVVTTYDNGNRSNTKKLYK